jgi:hypothetical protein
MYAPCLHTTLYSDPCSVKEDVEESDEQIVSYNTPMYIQAAAAAAAARVVEEAPATSFTPGQQIGQGSTAAVHHCSGYYGDCAVKVFMSGQASMMRKELALMKAIPEHKNLCRALFYNEQVLYCSYCTNDDAKLGAIATTASDRRYTHYFIVLSKE